MHLPELFVCDEPCGLVAESFGRAIAHADRVEVTALAGQVGSDDDSMCNSLVYGSRSCWKRGTSEPPTMPNRGKAGETPILSKVASSFRAASWFSNDPTKPDVRAAMWGTKKEEMNSALKSSIRIQRTLGAPRRCSSFEKRAATTKLATCYRVPRASGGEVTRSGASLDLRDSACSILHAHKHHIGPSFGVLCLLEYGVRKKPRCLVIITP